LPDSAPQRNLGGEHNWPWQHFQFHSTPPVIWPLSVTHGAPAPRQMETIPFSFYYQLLSYILKMRIILAAEEYSQLQTFSHNPISLLISIENIACEDDLLMKRN
jgi:hypothetical protein